MGELTLALARIGFLALLWIVVWSIVVVLRRDMYGTKISARRHRIAAQAVPQNASADRGRSNGRNHRADTPPAERRSQLVVVEGPLAGTVLPLTGASVLIGRAPGNTLVVDDDYASARHARVFQDAGRWWVEDLGSTNGTTLGGERISEPAPLAPGVPLRIGTTVLELQR